MTDVIEKAARAACFERKVACLEDKGVVCLSQCHAPDDILLEHGLIQQQRAALKVILQDMMEPSLDAILAGEGTFQWREIPGTSLLEDADGEQCFKAMLRAYAHEHGIDMEDGDG